MPFIVYSMADSALLKEQYEGGRRFTYAEYYWVIDPENKTLHSYLFENGIIFPHTYRASDTAPVEIFPGLSVSLDPVFAE